MQFLATLESDMCIHGDWLIDEAARVFEKYGFTHVICNGLTMTGTLIKDTNSMDVDEFDYPMILLGEGV